MVEPNLENRTGPKHKRASRRETAQRDARIVRALAHGEPIDEVAAREGLSLKRARERVAAVVARRAPEPTEYFVAVQIARLNEAMLIAYGAMKDGNLAAVDRVLKITREYDRYHGLALTLARRAGPSQSVGPIAAPLSCLPAPPSSSPARLSQAAASPPPVRDEQQATSALDGGEKIR